MLTERQTSILNLIVGEYVESAAPVPSQRIVAAEGMKYSPATIRFDMAELEGEGYIRRPHISSGGIPSNKGYRFHVESLPENLELPKIEVEELWRALWQSNNDIEFWTRNAAEILARLVNNITVVSAPKSPETKIKHIDLVQLQDFLALMVLVLQGAKVRKRLLHLDEPTTQEDLTAVANKFNDDVGGVLASGVGGSSENTPVIERQVLESAQAILDTEAKEEFGDIFATGFQHLFAQREFADISKAKTVIDALEDRLFVRQALVEKLHDQDHRVIIGDENDLENIDDCSLVVSRYGLAEEVGGFIAVIGPTRMDYARSIGSARLMARLLTILTQNTFIK